MNTDAIYELMDRFESSSIFSMKFKCEEFSLELSKTPPVAVSPALPHEPAEASSPVQPVQAVPADEAPEGETVTSPLAGTFYLAPSPDSEPFAVPGQHIKAGQTLCLVEAMKTMNEISAPCDMQVIAVLAEDATLVSYGEELIRYKKE